MLQLRWRHQFQFAGYYAAQAKGYFAAEGLQVDFRPMVSGFRVLDDLLHGKCDYAVGDGSLVLARQTGAPVVVVVPIFQSSPLCLITREQDHIDVPAQLKGKRLIVGTLADSMPIFAMLHDAGLQTSDFTVLPHSHRVEDLFDGKADAISGYVIDEPFFLAQQGLHAKVLWPVNYGIDFYGDLLYTSESEVKHNLLRALAMRRAVTHGWQYALDHPEEIINLIQDFYNPTLSTAQLRYEAAETRKLIRPDYVELGHLSSSRLQRMADIFIAEGLAPRSASIKGLTLDEYLVPDRTPLRWLTGLVVVILAATLGLAALVWLNRGLRALVAGKTAELQTANQALERDNQARKQAEEELRREQDFTDRVVNSIPGIFFVIDRQGRYVRWNQEQADLIGHDTVLSGVDPLTRIHPEDRQKVADAIAQTFSTGAALVEARGFVGQGPEIRHFLLASRRFDDAGASYLIGFGFDITARHEAELARQQLEEQLRQAQKLESVGRLAGGVAHDFNNLLTVILGYCSILLEKFPETDLRRPAMEHIRDAGTRAAELTSQLLAFSRRQIIEPKPIELNAEIARAEKLIARLLPENIAIVTRLDPSLGVVLADSGQIQQVLMNLAVNARDAMLDGGTLRIETANVDLDAADAAEHPDITPGPYVLLSIADTGIGMEKTVQEHVFEPFFTTKPIGEGTGLGLATVYGIVRQSDGWILVESTPHQGATFKIYLPRAGCRVEKAEPAQPVAATSAGAETVLIVEDLSAVRSLERDVLAAHGYRVLEAADGEEAIRCCEQYPEPIHLLLTDVVMPGINGKELADRCTALRPNVKVLFTSGYTEDVIAREGILNPGIAFVPKPLTPQILIAKVREVLEA